MSCWHGKVVLVIVLCLCSCHVDGFLSRKPIPTHKVVQRPVGRAVKAVDDPLLSIRNSTRLTSSEAQLYWMSLQWTPDEQLSKPCRDLWKWKDLVLGDGRDFFVPKPNTLKALQTLLRTHCGLTQVSVLSNCARMEILCVCDHDPILDISRVLCAQMQAQPPSTGGAWSILTKSMDIPDWTIRPMAPLDTKLPEAIELAQYWDVKNNSTDVLYHLCLVAAGMASRPRRPLRETMFRPFSSRDAHILLQLKRTKDIAEGNHVNQLLEYALRAGKVARNSDIVPSLHLLRPYGTGDSKYSSQPPRDLLNSVTKDVIALAIHPLVQEYAQVSSQSPDMAVTIGNFRTSMESLATTKSERAWLRKRLHQPTIDLRNGKLQSNDIPREQERIQLELFEFRKIDT